MWAHMYESQPVRNQYTLGAVGNRTKLLPEVTHIFLYKICS
jgi:hypothetical protein